MARIVDWYVDYVSPYPYLQLARFPELPADVEIRPVPVLFAGLLNHWEHKGPAEIPAKKRQIFFYTRWLAESRGLPFVGPPNHPFNPLPLLRLTIAAGAGFDLVARLFSEVWGRGRAGDDPALVDEIGRAYGLADPAAAIAEPAVKDTLRANTEAAIARGVYGVPTLACGGELFWGDDATPLFAAFLADPAMFTRPPYDRIGNLTPTAERRPRTGAGK